MSLIACVLLLLTILFYVFVPGHNVSKQKDKTRLSYLYERKEVVYENLRDLNFEFKSGKYPQQDYEAMRAGLENEAATILGEIYQLEQMGLKGQTV